MTQLRFAGPVLADAAVWAGQHSSGGKERSGALRKWVTDSASFLWGARPRCFPCDRHNGLRRWAKEMLKAFEGTLRAFEKHRQLIVDRLKDEERQ